MKPQEQKAPWPDFLGQDIHHGDRLAHPSGQEFVAIRLEGYEDEGDAWRAVYGNGDVGKPPNVSRLSLQVGDKGQAFLITPKSEGSQATVPADALDRMAELNESNAARILELQDELARISMIAGTAMHQTARDQRNILEDIAERCSRLSGGHSSTEQDARVAKCKKPFFTWDGDNGRQDFATQAEALAYAQETIGYYRRDARADGEWPDEVEGVIVGVVTHATLRDGSEEDGFDYRLAPAREAEKDSQPLYLQVYRATIKSRKEIQHDIPREHQGWWADVAAGQKLLLRQAVEADLERCTLSWPRSRNPDDYMCETFLHGSLVSKAAIKHMHPEEQVFAIVNHTKESEAA